MSAHDRPGFARVKVRLSSDRVHRARIGSRETLCGQRWSWKGAPVAGPVNCPKCLRAEAVAA